MTIDAKKMFEYIEQYLGVVPQQKDGDLDCPDEELLDFAARLDPLYDALPANAPPDDLWTRIVLSLTPKACAPVIGRDRFAHRKWQIATAAMSAIAASLFVVMLIDGKTQSPVPQPVQPREIIVAQAPLTALMTGSAGEPSRPAFVLATTANGRFIRSNPATAREIPSHNYHLWISNGTNYTYVGIVSPVISHSIPVKQEIRGLLGQGNDLVIDTSAGVEPLAQPVDIVARGQLLPIGEG